MAIKLLIVDDSALMRKKLREIFEEEGDFVIKTARNGKEAVEENLNFQPDVITLDINMPVMDGLTALAQIMATRPVPVVMVSSLTEKGALATFEALALGAVDYVTKPGGTISLSIDEIKKELIRKVRVAVRSKVRKRIAGLSERLKVERQLLEKDLQEKKQAVGKECLVVIGVSTGGPGTLEEILPALPAHFPCPVIVAQHMPEAFTGPFARRLDKLCALHVVEVSQPMDVEPSYIYIAKGGADVVVTRRAGKLKVIPKPASENFPWHPSVELLGRSVLEHCNPADVIAVLLTGMGNDGAAAFAEIKRRGGRTIAESEETAVVFGMPRELIERGGATVVLPSYKIAKKLMEWTREV